MTEPTEDGWRRLSPLMLAVHPAHELLRQLPLLIGAVAVGSATQNPLLTLLGAAAIMAVGVARWFTTSYRIGPDDVELRTGVLQRKALSVPRNRIRSVSTDARPLHRLLGLTVLRVSTGQQARGDNAFELDAVEAKYVAALRHELLARASAAPDPGAPAAPVAVLARWQPSWLRYSPLSWSGLVMILGGWGLIAQAGLGETVLGSAAGVFTGASASLVAAAAVAAVLGASVLLAVGQSLLSYANLTLTRSADTLNLTHGLLRVREHSYDMSRLRGATVREPLLVRTLGGARLDAVMTGVHGAGEASLLLPPCPRDTVRGVLAGLIGRDDVVAGPVVSHGPVAARRRWVRALALPVAVGLALAALAGWVPVWVWPVWAGGTGVCALLAADRVRALGHRVDSRWLVARRGSVARRRDCLQTAGVIGWTVRQTFFQRRAGVATLVAATAAGTKRYLVVDIPAADAWAVAATASPWVAQSSWCESGEIAPPGVDPARGASFSTRRHF